MINYKSLIKQRSFLIIIFILNAAFIYLNFHFNLNQKELFEKKANLLTEISVFSQRNFSMNELEEQLSELNRTSQQINHFYQDEKLPEKLQNIAKNNHIKLETIHISSNSQVKISYSANTTNPFSYLNDLLKKFPAISISDLSMQENNIEIIMNLPHITT